MMQDELAQLQLRLYLNSLKVPVYLAYPEELRHSKKIETFRDFVQDEIIEHRKKIKLEQEKVKLQTS